MTVENFILKYPTCPSDVVKIISTEGNDLIANMKGSSLGV